jgi:hypothetical protein
MCKSGGRRLVTIGQDAHKQEEVHNTRKDIDADTTDTADINRQRLSSFEHKLIGRRLSGKNSLQMSARKQINRRGLTKEYGSCSSGTECKCFVLFIKCIVGCR